MTWKVVHRNQCPQYKVPVEEPWTIVRFGRKGTANEKKIVQFGHHTFADRDEALCELADWMAEAREEAANAEDARDSALDPHGPWGAP